MTDREKVIKGLECAIDPEHNGFKDCHACAYRKNVDHLQYVCDGDRCIMDALALITAQEPRVMTLEEAKSAYVVEYRSGKMREVGSAFLDLNVDPLNAGYGKIYRVWSSRPTEEQREAVKWG